MQVKIYFKTKQSYGIIDQVTYRDTSGAYGPRDGVPFCEVEICLLTGCSKDAYRGNSNK